MITEDTKLVSVRLPTRVYTDLQALLKTRSAPGAKISMDSFIRRNLVGSLYGELDLTTKEIS